MEKEAPASFTEVTELSPEQFDAIKGERVEKTVVIGDTPSGPPKKIRTHHPWLHPTKGWRMFSRPRKANRGRRKLIHMGRILVFGHG